MRRSALALVAAGLLILTGCGSGGDPSPATPAAESPTSAPQVPGLAVYQSRFDVAETSTRVRDGLQQAGMVTAVVDHTANAAGVGLTLRPTTLVIGGAPPAGTPVMQQQQRAGADLPQKFLAWQAEDGTVYLGHNTAEYVGAQAGIASDSPSLDGLRAGSARIAAMASGNEAPVATGPAVSAVSAEGYLVERTSDATVAESIARYQRAFVERALLPVATVDHAAGASSLGERLRPTQVTFVGNPKAGTPLMQANQTIGIDLPIRYVAWQDAQGTVHVAHPGIRTLAQRHNVTGVDDVLIMIENATAMFTTTAAGGTG